MKNKEGRLIMRKRMVIIFSILLLLFSITDVRQTYAGSNIPSKAKEFNGNYYYVYEEKTTWETAKEYCEALGGHLAVITSASEQAFLSKLVSKNMYYWLGGYRVSNDWKWVTNETWNFTDWNYEGSGNYLYMNYSGYESWLTSENINNYNDGYICEWEAEDVDTRLPIKAVISSVKKASSTSATITWKRISDAEGYSVYMKTGIKGTYKKIADIKEGDIATYTQNGLEKGNTYYFRVRAYKTVYDEKSYGELSTSKKIYMK